LSLRLSSGLSFEAKWWDNQVAGMSSYGLPLFDVGWSVHHHTVQIN